MLVVFFTGSLLACGAATDASSVKALPVRHFGTDSEGAPCSLELVQSSSRQVDSVALAGTFTVDYRIPAPLSGLYGKYRWDGTLSSAVNMLESNVSASRSILRDADVVRGRGKPIFWDTPAHTHKLVVKPSLAAPLSVDYSASQNIAGVVPFESISLACRFAR
jgi:hypothetical protein